MLESISGQDVSIIDTFPVEWVRQREVMLIETEMDEFSLSVAKILGLLIVGCKSRRLWHGRFIY